MLRVFAFIIFLCNCTFCLSQIDTIENNDSILNNNTYAFSIELLGPAFLSSIGYAIERPIQEKMNFQFEFRIAGHFGNYGGKSWAIGPAMKQSILFGNKRLKLKLGLSEGVVFNPPSIKGEFDNLQPWDRPLKIITFFAVNLGSEFQPTKHSFFIIPNFYLPYMIGRGLDGEIPNEQLRLVKGFHPSFGLDLKIKL